MIVVPLDLSLMLTAQISQHNLVASTCARLRPA
jgi:hypothetical protein